MTVVTTEQTPCSADSPTARRPPSTRCRKHAFARFSSNVGLGTQFPGCSPRSRHVSYDLHRSLSVDCSVGRYYDPGTGQLLSVGPMVGRTGEPYAYAYDSPVNEKDPSGLKACEANEPGGKRCPYIRIHTTPEESGSGPTLYTIHVVVLNLTTIWPNGTVGTAYVNYHGVVATGPIDQWHDFGLAVLAHQSNGGEANYYETMVCNNYLSINVYLMKRHRGPAGPWVLNTNSAAYRSEPLFVGCEPIIELL
jgi:hypothetical protein